MLVTQILKFITDGQVLENGDVASIGLIDVEWTKRRKLRKCHISIGQTEKDRFMGLAVTTSCSSSGRDGHRVFGADRRRMANFRQTPMQPFQGNRVFEYFRVKSIQVKQST